MSLGITGFQKSQFVNPRATFAPRFFKIFHLLALLAQSALSQTEITSLESDRSPALEASLAPGAWLSLAQDELYPSLRLDYSVRAAGSQNALAIFYEFEQVGSNPEAGLPLRAFPFSQERVGVLHLPLSVGKKSAFISLVQQPDFFPKTMVWIPAGRFEMGSPESEPGRYEDEGPQHLAVIPSDFWLCKYEVTQAEFLAVMGGNPSAAYDRPDLPVEMVNWLEAMEYCARVTKRERSAARLPVGYVYRLPTEAEWEYACRAGTTTAFGFGDDVSYLGDYAWFADNGGPMPHPVGQKKPNAWGLHDMHGNVFEWCLDEYLPYPGGKSNRPAGSTVLYRPARGGAFYCPPEICRSACRFESNPQTSRSQLRGFRVAIGREKLVQ